MEKNIMYFAQKAEDYYKKMAGNTEPAEQKYVLVNMLTEQCLIVRNQYFADVNTLLFKVKGKDGEVMCELVRHRELVEEILGLNEWYAMKTIKKRMVDKDGNDKIADSRSHAYDYYGKPDTSFAEGSQPFSVCKITYLETLADDMQEHTAGWGDDYFVSFFEMVSRVQRVVREHAEKMVFPQSLFIPLLREEDDFFIYACFSLREFEVRDNYSEDDKYNDKMLVVYEYQEIIDQSDADEDDDE